MFRGDFEFHDAAPASHLGHGVAAAPVQPASSRTPPAAVQPSAASAATLAAQWAPEAEKELGKIPFFVRGKARRNTERFAAERALELITVETLYDAKAHFSR
jgi:light-independent protochlorophyllide reductase subunit B